MIFVNADSIQAYITVNMLYSKGPQTKDITHSISILFTTPAYSLSESIGVLMLHALNKFFSDITIRSPFIIKGVF